MGKHQQGIHTHGGRHQHGFLVVVVSGVIGVVKVVAIENIVIFGKKDVGNIYLWLLLWLLLW
jgi:hypothetical protein